MAQDLVDRKARLVQGHVEFPRPVLAVGVCDQQIEMPVHREEVADHDGPGADVVRGLREGRDHSQIHVRRHLVQHRGYLDRMVRLKGDADLPAAEVEVRVPHPVDEHASPADVFVGNWPAAHLRKGLQELVGPSQSRGALDDPVSHAASVTQQLCRRLHVRSQCDGETG